MLNNPEDLDDDRKELGKANKSLKIREAKLATISSKYKWYRKGLKSAIQNLEHQAVGNPVKHNKAEYNQKYLQF